MHIEYTDNLRGLDEAALLQALNTVVCNHPTVSDEADMKSRIQRLSSYHIGRNSTGRGFVHVQLSLLCGRSPEIKRQLSEQLGAALHACIAPHPDLEVQLSVDIADMDKDAYFKSKL